MLNSEAEILPLYSLTSGNAITGESHASCDLVGRLLSAIPWHTVKCSTECCYSCHVTDEKPFPKGKHCV